MAGFSANVDRKVIPRWRSFRDTLRLGETKSSTVAREHADSSIDFLGNKLAAWRSHRTKIHAADAVGAAICVARESEVLDAAEFLLDDSSSEGSWRRELAQRVLVQGGSGVTDDVSHPVKTQEMMLRSQIKSLREFLRIQPNDPVAWVDLSRLYAVLGLTEQAARCMGVGVQLASESRFVVRSASRLWTHLGDHERAHDVVVGSGRLRDDPWLLAAEVATASAAGKRSLYTRVALRMIESSQLKAAQISELSAALATLEMKSGSLRNARRLFLRSLESPTENSIAQAAWAYREKHGLRFDSNLLSRCPNTFEARYWDHYGRSEWRSVIHQCRLWQYDQPFSRTPGILGSYIAAVVLQNYRVSRDFSSLGLVANPQDPTLLNNLAFAELNLGDLQAAGDAIAKIDESKATDKERTVVKATMGLLQFRMGCIEEGRRLYTEAIQSARRIGDKRLLGFAQAFQAMEEPRTVAKRRLISEASSSLRGIDDPAVISFRGRLKPR